MKTNRLALIIQEIGSNAPHIVGGMILAHQITAFLLAVAGLLLGHKLAFYHSQATPTVTFFTWLTFVMAVVGFAYCSYVVQVLRKYKKK